MSVTQIIIMITLAGVAVILTMGLFNMARGGSAKLSQKLMRFRVFAQFIAIFAVIVAFYLFAD